MSIGEKLKKMRELRNLTQKELAEMSGIAFSQISKIELGNIQDPGISTVKKIAEALKITPLYFLDDNILTPFDIYDKWPEDVKRAF